MFGDHARHRPRDPSRARQVHRAGIGGLRKDCESPKTIYTLRKDSAGNIPQHALALAPFCHLANNLLRAMGYSDFRRRLSPLSSTLTAYELRCNMRGSLHRYSGPLGRLEGWYLDVHHQHGRTHGKRNCRLECVL